MTTPATSSSTTARFYRPELDALRFFAFLAVFVHHALQNGSAAIALGGGGRSKQMLIRLFSLLEQAGNFGMSLFFVLSAYLITQLLLLELERTGTVSVKGFYSRRVLRIWPLYFSFLALCVVLGWIFPGDFHVSMGRLAAFLLLSGNWYVISHSFAPFALGILWSISVEEQFYLLWPGVVLLGRGRRGIVIANAFFALVSVVTLCYLGTGGAQSLSAWLNSLVEFLFFAVGAQLAIVTAKRVPQWSMPLRAVVLAAGLACWLVAAGGTHFMQEPGPQLSSGALLAGYGLLAIGTGLIFLSLLGVDPRRVPRWLRYLGKISYGLYVFHMLMLMFSIWVLGAVAHALHLQGGRLVAAKVSVPLVALAFTVLTASLSYRWLETPFLKLRKRFTVVASRPV